MKFDWNPRLVLPLGLLLVAIIAIAVYVAWLVGNQAKSAPNDISDSGGIQFSHEEPEAPGTVSAAPSTINISSFEGSFDDLLGFYQQLNHADERNALQLLDDANAISSASRRSSIQRVIVQKLVATDPKMAAAAVMRLPRNQRDYLLEIVFEQWSLSDLDTCLRYVEKLDFSYKSAALESILRTRDDLSDDRRVEIARQLGDKSYGERVIAESRALDLVAESPLRAWDWLIQEDMFRDSHFTEIVKLVAQARVDQEGFQAVPHMLGPLVEEQPESEGTVDALIESFALRDPASFLSALSELSLPTQDLILPRMFEVWSKVDRAAAWNAVLSVRKETGTSNIASIVIDQWARSNPRNLIQSLEELTQVDQLVAIQIAIPEIARQSVEEALEIMTRLENQGTDIPSAALSNFVDIWSKRDPNAAIDWILSSSEDELGHDYGRIVEIGLLHLADVNPQRAFRLAIEQPLPAFGAPVETEVIRQLARLNLELALEYRGQVRDENRGRLSSYKHIGTELVKRGTPLKALELGYELPDEEQDDFFQSVIQRWAISDAANLFSNLEHIESEKLRMDAAQKLVMAQSKRPVLTEEQLNTARSYIQDKVIIASDLPPEELRQLVEKLKQQAQEKREKAESNP